MQNVAVETDSQLLIYCIEVRQISQCAGFRTTPAFILVLDNFSYMTSYRLSIVTLVL